MIKAKTMEQWISPLQYYSLLINRRLSLNLLFEKTGGKAQALLGLIAGWQVGKQNSAKFRNF